MRVGSLNVRQSQQSLGELPQLLATLEFCDDNSVCQTSDIVNAADVRGFSYLVLHLHEPTFRNGYFHHNSQLVAELLVI